MISKKHDLIAYERERFAALGRAWFLKSTTNAIFCSIVIYVTAGTNKDFLIRNRGFVPA